jgi:hypothetical protein
MPDEIPVVPPTKEEVAAANAEAIAKQKAQDISGQPTGADPGNLDTSSALDRLRELAVEQKKAATTEGDPTGNNPEGNQPPTEVKPPAGDPPVPAPTPENKPTAPAPTATPTADEAAVAARQLEAQRKADELFKDTPGLPPNSSVKASEAFTAIKVKAAQEIAERDQKLQEAQAKLKELEAKANAPIPDEITKELDSLREFRAKLDVETDPKFKAFDTKVNEVNEFIYAQLKRDPAITDAVIEDIKKYGGPGKVKMEKILDALEDPAIKRIVDSKLADIETISFEKQQAIKKAKENVREYLSEREKEFSEMAVSHNTTTKKTLENLASQIPWLNPVKVESTADEAAKKAAEAHNNYAAAMRKELDIAINDDSPEMRATLLLGMVNAFRIEESYKVLKTTSEAKIAELTKSLDGANATINRLRSAGANRLRESAAPAGGLPEVKPAPADQFNVSAADALDRLRKEKIAAAAQATT